MSDGFRLAVFTKNRLNPAYAGARTGIDRLAAAAGATVTHYVPDEPDSVPEQIAHLEAALRDPPDAILLTPNHGTAINGSLEKALEAGVPLFFFNAKPDGIDCVTYARSDDRELARAVARHLLEHMRGKGRILILRGHPDSMTTPPRDEGFEAALAEYPGASVAAVDTGYYQAGPARDVVARLIEMGVEFDGVLAGNDIMAVGALEAIKAAGRPPVPMVGINATPEGIAMLKSGELLATASFDAMKLACVAALAALRHLRGEAVPRDIVLPVEIVHPGICAAWDLPYEDRPLPVWEDVVGS